MNGEPADCVWLQTAVNWKGPYFIKRLILILLFTVHTKEVLYRKNLLIEVNLFSQCYCFQFQIQKYLRSVFLLCFRFQYWVILYN